MAQTLAVINHFKMSLRSQNGKPLSNICTGEERETEREEREIDMGTRKRRMRTVVCIYTPVTILYYTRGVVVWS